MRSTRWRRRLRTGVWLAAAVVAATGCSSSDDQTVRTGAPAAPRGAAAKPVTDARLVAGGLGWATTESGLFVTTDAGAAWRRWALPVPSASVLHVALLGPKRALVASNDGTAVEVLSTSDAGATWRRTKLGSVAAGPAEGQFAHEGDRVAGLLVKRATSSNFSLADWYATTDGGATWARREAPAAGQVSVTGDGTVWLAGGPARNQLFKSLDGGASWTEVALPPNLPRHAIALEAPVARPDGLTVLPVTVPGERTASVVFLATRDKGTSWKEAARAQVPAAVGAGVTIPSSPGATTDTLVVAAPDGSEVVRVPLRGGKPRKISPRGLAKGVVGVELTTEELGWATFTSSSCREDKTACTSTTGILVTRNGGESWQPANPTSGA
ncbi:MAG: hypothetical protein M3N68_07665 [Actinomycetota bacterium]|nr:hypothetical protein [Actinomycetota bacterium]